MLKELQQVIENNKLPPDCRSTAMEVFIKLLSKDSQNQCEGRFKYLMLIIIMHMPSREAYMDLARKGSGGDRHQLSQNLQTI